MREQLSIGAFPCRASLPRVDLLVYRRAGILIYSKESASRRPRSRCMQKRRPRCMRRQRGTNKARYRRQMSKAKLGFASAGVELRLEFHINFDAPESLAQSTTIGNIVPSMYLRDQ